MIGTTKPADRLAARMRVRHPTGDPRTLPNDGSRVIEIVGPAGPLPKLKRRTGARSFNRAQSVLCARLADLGWARGARYRRFRAGCSSPDDSVGRPADRPDLGARDGELLRSTVRVDDHPPLDRRSALEIPGWSSPSSRLSANEREHGDHSDMLPRGWASNAATNLSRARRERAHGWRRRLTKWVTDGRGPLG